MRSFQQRLSGFVQNQGVSAGFILALTALVFSNVFQNDFVRDDFGYILNWPLIQNLLNLPRFFVGFIPPEGMEGLYSPLKTFWHALLYYFFADNPLGYHVIALAIHLAGVLAAYHLTLVLTGHRPVAFLTALLFGLHPVHVESVTFLSSSVDTAGIVFLFVSFYCYIKAGGYGGHLFEGDVPRRRDEDVKENRAAYGCSLFFAVLAVFTHDLALALPFLFLFFDLGFRGRKETLGKIAGRTLPFFCVVIVYVLLKAWNLGGVTPGRYLSDSAFLTTLLMIKAFMKYVVVVLLPTTLSYDHAILPGNFSFGKEKFVDGAALAQSLMSSQMFLSFAVLAGLAIVLALAYRRRPLVSFCVGWFFIALLPVPVMISGPAYFSERYLYAASFAFCLLVSAGLVRWAARPASPARWLSLVLATGLVFFYAGRTVLRNQDWKDEKTICETIVRSNPQNAALRYDLALVYFELGELDKALSIMKSAIAMNPDEPYYDLALESIHSARGEYKESIRALKKAVELDPNLAEGYYNLAGIYAFLDFDDAAKSHLNKAIQLFKNRGLILEAGESAMALDRYMATRKAIKEGGAGLFMAPEN